MADRSLTFSRRLLATVHDDVRRHFPNLRPMRDAWVWNGGLGRRGNWEFHGPEGFFVGCLPAGNAYDARVRGWAAFLEHKGFAA